MDVMGMSKRRSVATAPRVKSMDELLLEESVRRNQRRGTYVPDLTVTGANAPGYQVLSSKKPITINNRE